MANNLLIHITKEDVSYLPLLKPLISGHATAFVSTSIPAMTYEMVLEAKKRDTTRVVTTSVELLKLLVPDDPNPKISLYAGSIITYSGIEFLILDPLAQLISIPYGKFVCERFLSKFLAPDQWITPPVFKWELFDPAETESYEEFFAHCDLLAFDTETIVDDPDKAIECISITGCMLAAGEIGLRTVVVPADSLFNIIFVRNVASNPVPKTLQNGKYDIAYYFRFGIILTNYAFDTINLFHCWLCELPKDLGFISAMTVRNYQYHKDEGGRSGKYARLSYCGKDTYYTLLATLELIRVLPPYAWTNYFQEFPVVFPCILSEHTGFYYDPVVGAKQKELVEKDLEKELASLRTMVNCPTFNPSSWQQVEKLYALLGSPDVKGTTPPKRDKVSYRHPLNKKILDKITTYREGVKLNSSYFKEGVVWNGKIFYAINPHGTDTGRCASSESAYWCGLQIQNIPSDADPGRSFKETMVADPGFYIGEADYSQNEARGTAYLSGDTALIEAVDDDTKDFHGLNASKFFGLPYEQIVKSYYSQEELEWVHDVLNKSIRTLSKRTNHGANYNMGPSVLLDTMGIEKVLEAKKLLNLPSRFSLLDVTTHLLDVFSRTYHIMKGPYYDKIKSDINSTGYLIGPTEWTRKCFGKPSVNKLDLNRYVAHPSQSLGAMVLNKAYVKVFREVWIPNQSDFRLNAQIHDSILFQYRIGREDLAWKVRECMKIPVDVTDTFGIQRTLIVPVDLKGNATRWSDVKKLRKHA